jgi:hypothetical protein
VSKTKGANGQIGYIIKDMKENKPKKTSLKDPLQLFKDSSTVVKRNLTLFIFLNAVPILGTAWEIGQDLKDKTGGSDWMQVLTHSFSGTSNDPQLNPMLIVIYLCAGGVTFLLAGILSVKAAQQKKVEFSQIWETFSILWWKLILVTLLTLLIILAGLVVFLIPGLYLLGRIGLAPIVLIDQNKGVIESLNTSWELTANKTWPVFVAFLFGFLLNIPSVIPIIGPLIGAALVIAYSVALPIRYFELKKLDKKSG